MVKELGLAVKAGGKLALYSIESLAATPVAAAALLGGIIGYQIWKGSKDAEELQARKGAAES